MFSFLGDSIVEDLKAKFAHRDEPPGEEEIASATAAAVHAGMDAAASLILSRLTRSARRMLANRRRRTSAFERGNMKRWRPAFKQIDILWNAAEEIGREFNKEFRPRAAAEDDYVFEALTRLNGRALQVAAEAIHLMKGGYADGALSRWRTQHELFVVAMFIKQHGKETAHRYLASVDFRRIEAAEQYNKHAERANLTPFPDSDIAAFRTRCKELEEIFGPELRAEYGWAYPAIDNKRPTFSAIEEALGLDHWRPRYKWASQHTHAGHRDLHAFLGMSEAESDLILVGQSNSGMVDPLQMTALHIASMTHVLLLSNGSVDCLVLGEVLQRMAKAVAPIAIACEAKSLEKHLRKNSSRRPSGAPTAP